MKPIINTPAIWQGALKFPRHEDGHKYDYGHGFIWAAPLLVGATALAASAAARMGTGLVTILTAPIQAQQPIQAQHQATQMPEETAMLAGLRSLLPAPIMMRPASAALLTTQSQKRHISAQLIGSGGLPDRTSLELAKNQAALWPTIIDADGLTPENLAAFDKARAGKDRPAPLILTPHRGEFTRCFGPPPDDEATLITRLAELATSHKAVILLKGRVSYMAAPENDDGSAALLGLNHHACPSLATAGSGDVLAGFILGLLCQGLAPFQAVMAATWLHGEAAICFEKQKGHGMIASDLPDMLPPILKQLCP